MSYGNSQNLLVAKTVTRYTEKPYEVMFSVIGRGAFPFDMLCYDRCFPIDSINASKLDRDYGDQEVREIQLVATVHRKNWEPTVDRWASFGWSVRSTLL